MAARLHNRYSNARYGGRKRALIFFSESNPFKSGCSVTGDGNGPRKSTGFLSIVSRIVSLSGQDSN